MRIAGFLVAAWVFLFIVLIPIAWLEDEPGFAVFVPSLIVGILLLLGGAGALAIYVFGLFV